MSRSLLALGFYLLLLTHSDVDAALLGSYHFNGNANATLNGTLSGYSLSQFDNVSAAAANGLNGSVANANGGASGGNRWLTSNTINTKTWNSSTTPNSVNYNRIVISATAVTTVSSLDLKMYIFNPNETFDISSSASLDIRYATTPSGQSQGAFSNFGSGTLNSTTRRSGTPTAQSLVLSSPITLNAGDSLELRFFWYRTSLSGATGSEVTRIGIDDINLYGTAVPEPATLGIFGVGALGGIIARRRNSNNKSKP